MTNKGNKRGRNTNSVYQSTVGKNVPLRKRGKDNAMEGILLTCGESKRHDGFEWEEKKIHSRERMNNEINECENNALKRFASK